MSKTEASQPRVDRIYIRCPIQKVWEAMGAGGGWSWILSDMKSVLETGKNLKG